MKEFLSLPLFNQSAVCASQAAGQKWFSKVIDDSIEKMETL
jgi:hypothetical protein